MDNVVISGTHTHSAPGGFMMSLLYDMTTFGFVGETYRALIDGIYNVSYNSSSWLKIDERPVISSLYLRTSIYGIISNDNFYLNSIDDAVGQAECSSIYI